MDYKKTLENSDLKKKAFELYPKLLYNNNNGGFIERHDANNEIRNAFIKGCEYILNYAENINNMKINLTEYQKNFLLYTFFRNENYANWKEIATTLLEKGKCTVAGDQCIWNGGVGNFIKTESSDDAFGCLVYTFNINKFLISKYFSEQVHNHELYLTEKIKETKNNLKNLEEELNDLYNIYDN